MKTVNNILLIANGKCEDAAFIKTLAKENDFVLAVDGGADTALKAGVTPDLVIGDLDSISPAAKEKLGKDKLFKISRQDNTDLEKALDFTLVLNPKTTTIICASGGRLDFTLSNVSSVFNYTKKLHVVLKGKGWRIYPIEKSAAFTCKKGATVSLIPMSAAKGITLKNLKYPLNNATLKTGLTAVSNVAKKDNFEVLLKSGKLLVMIYD
jgi:thiamine pyrophosphokinase